VSVSFTDNTSTAWVSLEFTRARGGGRVNPSLILDCEARTPIANARVEHHHVKAELFQESEAGEYVPLRVDPSQQMGIGCSSSPHLAVAVDLTDDDRVVPCAPVDQAHPPLLEGK
jgi:hypothetical protein